MQSMHFTVFAGKEPPEDFIEAALKKYNKAVTAAAVIDGNVEVLEYFNVVTATDIKNIREALGDDKIVTFWLAANASDIPSEEKQPFSFLSDADNNQHIVGFLDGDFESYKKTDSTFTGAHHASQDYVYEKVNSLLNKLGTPTSSLEDDIKATITDMTTTERADIQTQLFAGKRGVLTVIASIDGNTLHRFSLANDRQLIADWGWSSDSCSGTAPVTSSKYALRGKTKTPGSATAAPEPTSVDDLVWIKPSTIVQGNTDTKLWYAKVFGKPMNNAADLPAGLTMSQVLNKEKIQVPKERLADLRKMGLEFEVVTHTDPKSKTDTTSKHIPDSGAAVPLPLMGITTQDRMVELFTTPKSLGAALLDGTSKKLWDLETLKAVREKHKNWFQQLEQKSPDIARCANECVRWPYPFFETMAFKDAKGAAILMWDLAVRAFVAESALAELEAPVKNADKETLTLATPTAQEGAKLMGTSKYARR